MYLIQNIPLAPPVRMFMKITSLFRNLIWNKKLNLPVSDVSSIWCVEAEMSSSLGTEEHVLLTIYF